MGDIATVDFGIPIFGRFPSVLDARTQGTAGDRPVEDDTGKGMVRIEFATPTSSSFQMLIYNGPTAQWEEYGQAASAQDVLPTGSVDGSLLVWDKSAWVETSAVTIDPSTGTVFADKVGVGAGMTDPRAALEVDGDIRVSEAITDGTGQPVLNFVGHDVTLDSTSGDTAAAATLVTFDYTSTTPAPQVIDIDQYNAAGGVELIVGNFEFDPPPAPGVAGDMVFTFEYDSSSGLGSETYNIHTDSKQGPGVIFTASVGGSIGATGLLGMGVTSTDLATVPTATLSLDRGTGLPCTSNFVRIECLYDKDTAFTTSLRFVVTTPLIRKITVEKYPGSGNTGAGVSSAKVYKLSGFFLDSPDYSSISQLGLSSADGFGNALSAFVTGYVKSKKTGAPAPVAGGPPEYDYAPVFCLPIGDQVVIDTVQEYSYTYTTRFPVLGPDVTVAPVGYDTWEFHVTGNYFNLVAFPAAGYAVGPHTLLESANNRIASLFEQSADSYTFGAGFDATTGSFLGDTGASTLFAGAPAGYYLTADLGAPTVASEITMTSAGATVTAASDVTYVVTVGGKAYGHPYYGTGSSMAYFIDGAMAPALTLEEGRTYIFDQSATSNYNHPLRLYTTANKSALVTAGVVTYGTPGTAGAYTKITVAASHPATMSYQCAIHAYMGSQVTRSVASTGSTTSFPRSGKVYGSTDGSAWTEVAAFQGLTDGGSGASETVKFAAPVTYRHYALLLTQVNPLSTGAAPLLALSGISMRAATTVADPSGGLVDIRAITTQYQYATSGIPSFSSYRSNFRLQVIPSRQGVAVETDYDALVEKTLNLLPGTGYGTADPNPLTATEEGQLLIYKYIGPGPDASKRSQWEDSVGQWVSSGADLTFDTNTKTLNIGGAGELIIDGTSVKTSLNSHTNTIATQTVQIDNLLERVGATFSMQLYEIEQSAFPLESEWTALQGQFVMDVGATGAPEGSAITVQFSTVDLGGFPITDFQANDTLMLTDADNNQYRYMLDAASATNPDLEVGTATFVFKTPGAPNLAKGVVFDVQFFPSGTTGITEEYVDQQDDLIATDINTNILQILDNSAMLMELIEDTEPPWIGLDPGLFLQKATLDPLMNPSRPGGPAMQQEFADAGWDTKKLLEQIFIATTGYWFSPIKSLAFSLASGGTPGTCTATWVTVDASGDNNNGKFELGSTGNSITLRLTADLGQWQVADPDTGTVQPWNNTTANAYGGSAPTWNTQSQKYYASIEPQGAAGLDIASGSIGTITSDGGSVTTGYAVTLSTTLGTAIPITVPNLSANVAAYDSGIDALGDRTRLFDNNGGSQPGAVSKVETVTVPTTSAKNFVKWYLSLNNGGSFVAQPVKYGDGNDQGILESSTENRRIATNVVIPQDKRGNAIIRVYGDYQNSAFNGTGTDGKISICALSSGEYKNYDVGTAFTNGVTPSGLTGVWCDIGPFTPSSTDDLIVQFGAGFWTPG